MNSPCTHLHILLIHMNLFLCCSQHQKSFLPLFHFFPIIYRFICLWATAGYRAAPFYIKKAGLWPPATAKSLSVIMATVASVQVNARADINGRVTSRTLPLISPNVCEIARRCCTWSLHFELLLFTIYWLRHKCLHTIKYSDKRRIKRQLSAGILTCWFVAEAAGQLVRVQVRLWRWRTVGYRRSLLWVSIGRRWRKPNNNVIVFLLFRKTPPRDNVREGTAD